MNKNPLVCNRCGSPDVETLYTCWIKENEEGEPPEIVDEAKAYPDRHWCNCCNDHPSELVSRLTYRRNDDE